MMNPLYQIHALGLELTVIPPLFQSGDSDCVIGERFSSITEHLAAVSEVQRFRGRVYVEDGAIPAGELDEEGRHYQEFDFENYHLCLRDAEQRIRGCFRLRLHEQTVRSAELHPGHLSTCRRRRRGWAPRYRRGAGDEHLDSGYRQARPDSL